MRYTVATFDYHFQFDWQRDLFEQGLADLGFETFCQINGKTQSQAYIQTDMLREDELCLLVQQSKSVQLISLSNCPDDNWNQTWEVENPEFTINLPKEQIIIRPHCAFGAGYHETTGMLIEHLLALRKPLGNVLDNGCGTGILGIVAARLGATSVTMIDIDDKSTDNARENALLNGLLVGNNSACQISILLGDTPPPGQYDLVLSNIHKNILIAQMPLYTQIVKNGCELWMSGFFMADSQHILSVAKQNGFHLIAQYSKGNWAMLMLQRGN